MSSETRSVPGRPAPSLAYAGAGGNIGSHAVTALARSGVFRRLTLIDPDVYEAHNVRSQDIERQHVGRPKVEVLAARLRRIDPDLHIEALPMPLEQVPYGRLRADVLASGLDGLAARRSLNRVAWRLGIPWVDAGVRAEGLLARVDVFLPAEESGCMECGWDASERASVNRIYPCERDVGPAPTGAPAYLGALAASLQCAECVKLGAGELGVAGQQILFELGAHQRYLSGRVRSAGCEFDHRRWALRRLEQTPGALTVIDALRLVPDRPGRPTRLRVHGDVFVRRLVCPRCPASRRLLGLGHRLEPGLRRCPGCDATMVAAGLDVADAVTAHDVRAHGRTSMFSLGLRAGDVFSLDTGADETHFEIGSG